MISKPSKLQKAERVGQLLEDAVLVFILGGMILLAAAQIVLRNVFDFGFIWSDELLRLLVLWIALAGAVAASRSDKHINIAVLDRFLPRFASSLAKIVIHLFTAAICGVVTVVSARFVYSSWEYGDILLGAVPAWLLQIILPLGFALMTWRYGVFVMRAVISLFRRPVDA